MDVEYRLKWLKNFDALVASKRKERNRLGAGIGHHLGQEMELGQATRLNEQIRLECQQLDADIVDLYDERKKVVAAIDCLADPDERLILRKLYINCEPWAVVCYDLSRSRSSCQEIKRRAVRHLGCLLEKVEG